jgi:hypothetical protein
LKELAQGEADLDSPTLMPIVKIHGSANWFLTYGDKNKEDCISMPPDVPNYSPGTTIEHFARAIRGSVNLSGGRRADPMIIPPMLGKATLKRIISRQWSAAIRLLSSARILCIIGYSFPETDAFMPRLLAEGMQQNGDLDEVVIVNREPQEKWRSRVKQLFTPSVRHKVGYISNQTVPFINQWSSDTIHFRDKFCPIWF